MNLNGRSLTKRNPVTTQVDPYNGQSILERVDENLIQISEAARKELNISPGDYVGIETEDSGNFTRIHNFGQDRNLEFPVDKNTTITLGELINKQPAVVHCMRPTGRFNSKTAASLFETGIHYELKLDSQHSGYAAFISTPENNIENNESSNGEETHGWGELVENGEMNTSLENELMN